MGETFWGLVARSAAEHPDRVLLADDHGRSLTAAQLAAAAEATAAGLLAEGVSPGDLVSWQLPTVLEAPVLMAALARLGVVQNPIIPLLRHREVGHICRQLGTRLAIVPRVLKGFDHAAMVSELGIPSLVVDLDQEVGTGLRLPAGDPSSLPDPPTDPGTFRWAYYSSGTTAAPKGARHTDASVMASATGMVDPEGGVGYAEGDVYPIAWPFTHIGGITMLTTALQGGARLVLFDTWDPATTPERMAAHRPTVLGSATPFFRAYLDAHARHGGTLFTDVRACVGGGAPTPQEINRELAETFGIGGVVSSYGLTEFPIATSQNPAEPGVGTTIGRFVPGVTGRLVDGELRLKGPQCCLGYVDPALDEAGFDDDGWFRTGDLAEIDADGLVRITGRAKDVIIRNAENISALEVEDAVLRHPDVVDVGVVGMPDARTGERVCAVVVLADGADLDVAALGEHCRAAGLARYKCPEQVVAVPAIERNPMGKILKDKLREQLDGASSPR
jgi:acyl-CoA synthetase (AMP-forming)/AMP-acid ligase II